MKGTTNKINPDNAKVDNIKFLDRFKKPGNKVNPISDSMFTGIGLSPGDLELKNSELLNNGENNQQMSKEEFDYSNRRLMNSLTPENLELSMDLTPENLELSRDFELMYRELNPNATEEEINKEMKKCINQLLNDQENSDLEDLKQQFPVDNPELLKELIEIAKGDPNEQPMTEEESEYAYRKLEKELENQGTDLMSVNDFKKSILINNSDTPTNKLTGFRDIKGSSKFIIKKGVTDPKEKSKDEYIESDQKEMEEESKKDLFTANSTVILNRKNQTLLYESAFKFATQKKGPSGEQIENYYEKAKKLLLDKQMSDGQQNNQKPLRSGAKYREPGQKDTGEESKKEPFDAKSEAILNRSNQITLFYAVITFMKENEEYSVEMIEACYERSKKYLLENQTSNESEIPTNHLSSPEAVKAKEGKEGGEGCCTIS